MRKEKQQNPTEGNEEQAERPSFFALFVPFCYSVFPPISVD